LNNNSSETSDFAENTTWHGPLSSPCG